MIRSISDDISRICPLNLSVAEVENTPQNQLANICGDWTYADGKIAARQLSVEEHYQIAEHTKKQLAASSEAAIAPLTRAVRLGLATENEVKQLDAWERYSVLLNRIDLSTAPDIDWPTQP